ncbi:TPA: sodium-dependent transporter [Photobacterium damselae]|uniref:Transporter n=2 Tax=Photobacterium damselae TaxID=38293 RepID=A0ABD6X012_PHODM|nr:sodium-dependent transporter [Photobacterium damselae]ARR49163.1 sodium-dependent transporter [Photobacterium damselae subsp. damselae]EJN6960573.1 sodium-dependent transporter [Photobacterium damselae]EJN6962135.1 sodium-dependent transporter [Photobacterium damselae]KAB1177335.1 sodium-dependent transporter [Photobacterium damselae subsp. damselae]KAB1177457.1 sodium-dependent transporter [Photobacterium damselae subsp. damselae]
MSREQWGSRAGFILAAVGSAIGLGNIWRFPYMAYENGGGAFFIPYLFAMLTAGIPFMIMEFTLGHKLRSAAPRAFAKLGGKYEWLGWFQVFIAAVIAVYYVAVIGWAISYLGFSFKQSWGSDTNAFFFSEYLKLGEHSPSQLGGFQLHIAIPMMIAWAITFAAIYSGVKGGIERASKIMMPLLFIMVLGLITRVVFLPGALDGLNYLFQPDFSKILDAKVWSAAYGQIFFTLSVGFAIMIAYSSYLPSKSDINNNAFMTVLINCGFSITAGVLIFAVLGYMAQEQAKPLTEVVSAGVGLAFVTIPAAINLLPAPYILGPLFFLALVVAGLSSHISIIEAVTSAVIDKLNWSRKKAAIVVCGTGFIVSMAFATNGGLLLLDLVDYFINNVALLSSCLLELLIVGWLVKIADIRQYANSISDFTIGKWFELCIRFISPIMLAIILVTNLYKTLAEGYGGYDMSDLLTLGWGLVGMMIVVSIIINLASKSPNQQEV